MLYFLPSILIEIATFSNWLLRCRIRNGLTWSIQFKGSSLCTYHHARRRLL